MGPRIFINYRREDSRGSAGRLHDRLVDEIPDAQLFMDVDAIAPGVDFVSEIERAVTSCDVLLVVIGRDWLTATDRRGHRRLDNPEDLVRLEVATALKHGVRTIPVLVDGATIPAAADLPSDIQALVRRNAVELSHQRFAADIRSLARALVPSQDQPKPQPAIGDRERTAAPAAAPGAVGPGTPIPPWRMLAVSATVFAIVSSGAIAGLWLAGHGTEWWFLRLGPLAQIWITLNPWVAPALALKLWIPRISGRQVGGVLGATFAAQVAVAALPQVLQPVFLSYFPADPDHGVEPLLWIGFVTIPVFAGTGLVLGFFLAQALRSTLANDAGRGFTDRMMIIWSATGTLYGIATFVLVALGSAAAARWHASAGSLAVQQHMLMWSETVLYGLAWALGLFLTLRLAPRAVTRPA